MNMELAAKYLYGFGKNVLAEQFSYHRILRVIPSIFGDHQTIIQTSGRLPGISLMMDMPTLGLLSALRVLSGHETNFRPFLDLLPSPLILP